MDAIEKREKMLNTKIPKLVLSMSIPTVISQLITVIYNTADTYFVSHISTSASAAVGISFSLQSIIQAIGFGCAMGAGTIISIALGKKDKTKASSTLSSSLFMALILGILMEAIGLIFLRPLMKLLGAIDTNIDLCISYSKYILIASPFFTMQFVLNNILRSEGNATYSMVGITSGGILNMILDPILIFKLSLGIEGAAIATMISQIFSFIVLLIMTLKKSILDLKIRYISLHIKDYLNIISTGVPTIFRQGLGSVSTALLNNSINIYGDAAIAAISIANKVYMLIRNIVIGVGQGFQPIAGYNYGAKRYKRVKKTFLFTSFIGTITCIVFTIFVFIFKKNIITFFRDDPEVIKYGVIGLNFYLFSIPFLALSTFINQLYQSLGYKVIATLLASLRQGIFYIPLIFILRSLYKVNGILSVQSISDILTFIVSIPFLIYFFKKYLNKEDEIKEIR